MVPLYDSTGLYVVLNSMCDMLKGQSCMSMYGKWMIK
jgi:hypothetical protein